MKKRWIVLTVFTILYIVLAEITAYGCLNHWKVNVWLFGNVQVILFVGGIALPLGWIITLFWTIENG